MKVKVTELEGHQLNYAVALADGVDARGILYTWNGQAKLRVPSSTVPCEYNEVTFNYAYDWAQGGPIIQRECIAISCIHTTGYTPDTWDAQHPQRAYAKGKTPLIAAMRCFVAHMLGDEVEINELVTNNGG